MGAYAQRRHRGGSGHLRRFPLDEPAPEIWTFNNDGFSEGVAVLISGTCAVGADGFRLAVTTAPGNDPDSSIQADAPCADPAIIGGFGTGDVLNGWIRWMLGSEPVSDWSVMKQTTIP